MGTRTPLRHPNEQKQQGQFYPHTAEFKETVATGAQPLQFTSKCAYEPYQSKGSGEGEMFETEPVAGDQLLLPYWENRVKAKQLVVLTFADRTTRRFVVIDAAPEGPGPSQTLVLLTPK